MELEGVILPAVGVRIHTSGNSETVSDIVCRLTQPVIPPVDTRPASRF